MYHVQSYINTTFNTITNKEKTSSYKGIIQYVQLICLPIDNQWSTTGISKAVVCTVLSMEKCI